MTTKPYPESNPHPEKGPLWVQWDADAWGATDRLMSGNLFVRWMYRPEAITVARQIGQECPPPPTKKVLWKHAIGERLPDGREITGAWGVTGQRRIGVGGACLAARPAQQPDPDGMVEVLA